jgi:hypothetical protein
VTGWIPTHADVPIQLKKRKERLVFVVIGWRESEHHALINMRLSRGDTFRNSADENASDGSRNMPQM